MTIYQYWREILAGVREPLVVEVGVHHATSTVNLRACTAVEGKAMRWLGIEPDPRNAARCRELGFEVVEAAASDKAGTATLLLSSGITPGYSGRLHTDSSSIQAPTAHLKRYPWCRFDEFVTVPTVRLDDLIPPGDRVTLLWADVQGAQRKLIAGAQRVLQQTDWLYIECPPVPMYEGETTFDELCALLTGWEVVHRWPEDVLFRRIHD